MATQGKQRSIWKEKTGPSLSSPRHTRKPQPTGNKSVPKSQNNAKHRPGIVLLGTKSSPTINNNSSMRYADVLKGSSSTFSLPKTEETTPVKELFLPSDFPVISAEKKNPNHLKRFKEEKNEKGIEDIRVESTKQHKEELVDENIDENHTFVIVDSNEQRERDKEEESVMDENVINEEEQSIMIDGEGYSGQEQQQQNHDNEEEKFLKPTEILKLMKAKSIEKDVALTPTIKQVIRCSNSTTNNNNRPVVKKEAATSVAAYNEVIEETASKLIAEENRNKVLALVGAFETVISLENEGINE
ncbi:uncharacterized protein LOC124930552 [Impatiens glandulifera]|uniref:uncharacterized protein LOC124930552 n=1 Tax=Impatiens glandulifera TaxID=253017 RepID=UPI001FB11389|nr:uncharacterized protein LOC124930552 [Impatiens glandulifera]